MVLTADNYKKNELYVFLVHMRFFYQNLKACQN